MAWEVQAAVWKCHGVGMMQKYILLAIADAVDKKTGYAYRSFDYLAKRTEANRRTVIRTIEKLEQRAWIQLVSATRVSWLFLEGGSRFHGGFPG